MEEKIKVELTNNELEIVYRGLLELPSKFSLSVIQNLEKQLRKTEAKDEATTE
jgi:hypothetical protein